MVREAEPKNSLEDGKGKHKSLHCLEPDEIAVDRTVICGLKSKRSASLFHPTPAARPGTTIGTSSQSHKLVFLHDWWLVKANGKGIAVQGFAHKDDQRISLFCSAAVVKRHDTTTIEAADGVTILISGMINVVRAHENGFPSEVTDRFLLGFPYDWEEYSMYCSHDCSSQNKLQATSLDGCRVRRVWDVLTASSGDGNNVLVRNICDEALRKFGNIASNRNGSLYLPNILYRSPERDTNRSCKVPVEHHDIKDNSNGKEDANSLTEEKVMANMVVTPQSGVLTRSMRRKRQRCKKENNVFEALP